MYVCIIKLIWGVLAIEPRASYTIGKPPASDLSLAHHVFSNSSSLPLLLLVFSLWLAPFPPHSPTSFFYGTCIPPPSQRCRHCCGKASHPLTLSPRRKYVEAEPWPEGWQDNTPRRAPLLLTACPLAAVRCFFVHEEFIVHMSVFSHVKGVS